MPRDVRLLLLSEAAEPLGLLAPVTVPSAWWPDVEPVVAAVRDRWDVDVLVLRVLSGQSRGSVDGVPAAHLAGETPEAVGGSVTYLAQARGPLPAGLQLDRVLPDQVAEVLAPEPLRAPWAEVDGPAAIAAWADDALARAGRRRTGPVEQVKTWNLSSILRLPTDDGPVWCKSVPPFFAHEGEVIARVARRHPHLVPQVVAADLATGTILMADAGGEDQWDAPLERLLEMVTAIVDVQSQAAGEVADLLTLGLPDWRGPALAASLAQLVERPLVRGSLDDPELAELDALVAALPGLVDELAACGLPDTLVHGDLHPGNWVLGRQGLLLLDWGDSGVGHPMLDQPAFLARVVADDARQVRRLWAEQWRERYPDADTERAADLARPLAALRQALIYQGFLDRIEPDERVYHRPDVPLWLRRAVRIGVPAALG